MTLLVIIAFRLAFLGGVVKGKIEFSVRARAVGINLHGYSVCITSADVTQTDEEINHEEINLIR
jgi:hypothetical protein